MIDHFTPAHPAPASAIPWRAPLRAFLLSALIVVAIPVSAQDIAQARQLFAQARYSDARAQFTELARKNATDPEPAYYLGRIALVTRDADQAVRSLERATSLAPQSSVYHQWLGSAYGQQAIRANRFRQIMLAKRVQGEFEEAVRLDAANIDARMGLLQFYLVAPGIMGGSTTKAQQQAAEVRRRNPFRGHMAYAGLAESRRDDAAAETEYQAAIAEHPDSLDAPHALSMMYQRTKQFDKSFALAERLISLHPGDAAAHYYFGRAAALSGQNMDRGEQELHFYLAQPEREGAPPHASAWVRLGMIAEKRGQKDVARAAFNQAIRLDPQQPEARAGLQRVR